MKRLRRGIGVALALMMNSTMMISAVMMISLMTPSSAAAQTAGLRIIVIEGEDAINVVQQKTAVSPIVEVRDLNGLPVGGASVKFEIQGGRATFNGGRSLSVTTNAAGRASVTGLTPSSAGAFQITASATFQGLKAAATIAQTNVMTLAQVAAVAGAAGGAAGAGAAGAGAAGAGGAGAGVAAGAGGAAASAGGISAATIGIVGGAIAGGAIAAKQVVAGGGGGSGIYEGEFRIDVVNSTRQVRGNGTIALSCTSNISFTGEVRGEIDVHEDGTLAGTISANGYYNKLSTTCPPSAPGPVGEKIGFGSGVVTGTTATFQADGQTQSSGGSGGLSFSGALNDGVITGTFTLSSSYKSTPDAGGFYSEESYPATSTQVRLTK